MRAAAVLREPQTAWRGVRRRVHWPWDPRPCGAEPSCSSKGTSPLPAKRLAFDQVRFPLDKEFCGYIINREIPPRLPTVRQHGAGSGGRSADGPRDTVHQGPCPAGLLPTRVPELLWSEVTLPATTLQSRQDGPEVVEDVTVLGDRDSVSYG